MLSSGTTIRPRVLAAVCAVALAALTACSSSSSNSSSSQAAAGAGSSSPASSSQGSATPRALATAEALTAQAEALPTSIPVTQPLKTAPPKGKTFVWLKCDVATCVELSQGIKAALTSIGWTYKEIDYQSANPATLVAGFKLALNYHPSAVGVSGIPPAAGWSSILPQYAKAGIPIIASFLSGLTYTSTIIGDIGGAESYDNSARMVANWFIADSKGQGKAVLYRVDDFPILATWSDTFAATVKAGCPDCSIKDVDATIPDALSGAGSQTVISAVRSSPGTSYIIACDAEFLTGLDSALSAAGLAGKVKFAGQGGTVDQLAAMKSHTGSEAAFTGLALHYAGWSMVDLALRHLEGMTFSPEDGGLPMQLLIPGNQFAVSTSYDQPGNYAAQFEKLWHVG